MTANTTDEQRMEAAVQRVTAKLERFQEGLSPEERFTLGAAFWKARPEAHTATGEVVGYDYAIDRAAKAYEDSLPIWDALQ
ncbi:MAG: hypothetical protein ACRDJE_24790, partial [Dehalococcoidia bacterium]